MIKQLRYYLRLIIAFVRKERQLIIGGMVVGAGIFYLFPKFLTIFPHRFQEKIGIVGRFTVGELPLQIQKKISSGLTIYEISGETRPSLALSWEIKNDGKEYIFKLKDDAYWQDGSLLNADDINYNFSDVATSVLDNKTIVFRLKDAFSPFPSVVSQPVFKKGLVGTGDYRVTSLKKQGQVVEKLVLKSKIAKDSLFVYKFYPSEETARTAYKLGEIDTIEKITDIGDLDQWPKSNKQTVIEKSRYVGIFFNTEDKDLGDKNLRQALAYAIKKTWTSRALSPINPDSWAYNPNVKPYDYDIVNANKLYAKSQEGKEDKDKFKEINLSTVPSLVSVADEIAKYWEALGLKTNIQVINEIPDNFQALLVAQEIPLDPDQYSFWHSTQPDNINLSRYQNPKIDKLLEDGRKTFDTDKRKSVYFDFQRFIVEDTPAIFLYHPVLYTITRNYPK